jgi:hypothetical protein
VQPKLKQALTVGMVLKGPNVPDGTIVKTIDTKNGQEFNFKPYEKDKAYTVLQVGLSNAVPGDGTKVIAYNLANPQTDYATTKLVNLWYTWANYYVEHVGSKPANNLPGTSLSTNKDKLDNVIKLTNVSKAVLDGLKPGMLVTGSTGSGIFPLRPDGTGATTILSIDPDGTIHLSQAVGFSAAGNTYSFAAPTMNSPAMVGFKEATLLQGFNPKDNEVPGVAKVLDFAQNVYQLLSLMSQVPDLKNGPISTQVLANVIGGNIRFPVLNADAFSHTEVAFRSKIKSALRGVSDYLSTVNDQNLEKSWYPEPSQKQAGLAFNAYNLDPFVWFIHKQMGLSGYGFSLDDDTADVNGNFGTKLGIAIGGLNGLPNQYEWTLAAPYGPMTGTATVTSAKQVTGLPPYTFFSVARYDINEKVRGANVQGVGVNPGANIADYGPGGIYKYSWLLTQQPPTPSDQLIPPLKVGDVSTFTALGRGNLNYDPRLSKLPPGVTNGASLYMNALIGLTVPSGSTFNINASFGSLTSYTQQFEEIARVSNVPVAALNPSGVAPEKFIGNVPLPNLVTTVDGTLHAGRVNIVDGWLASTGLIDGNLSVFASVAGYDDPIGINKRDNEKVDTGWKNQDNKILETSGGFLAPGKRPEKAGGDGIPGKLTVNGNVYLYGATLTIYATGASKQGVNYGWLDSAGQVSLGNSKLDLSLIKFIPQVGDNLVIMHADKGVVGKFSQGDSIVVGDFKFKITYSTTYVTLTRVPSGPTIPAPTTSVPQLYRALLNREAGEPELSYWTSQLDQGATPLIVAQRIYDSVEHRGIQVDEYYQVFLNRPSDPLGRAAWVSAFTTGMSETDVQAGFLTSAEYLHQHAGPAGVVQSIFDDVLGRAATEQDVAFWASVAQSPAGVGALALGILNSPEAQTREITFDYEALLGREPDAEGLNMWLALLSQHKITTEQVELGILTSDEFFGLGQ